MPERTPSRPGLSVSVPVCFLSSLKNLQGFPSVICAGGSSSAHLTVSVTKAGDVVICFILVCVITLLRQWPSSSELTLTSSLFFTRGVSYFKVIN